MRSLPALVTVALTALLGCSADELPPPSEPEAAAQLAVSFVRSELARDGVALETTTIALHRYPEAVAAGAIVTDRGGTFRHTVTSRQWLFWWNPDPDARFSHPSRALLVDVATGQTTMLDTPWWPIVEGRSPRWDEGELILEQRDEGGVIELDAAASSLATAALPLAEGQECTPRRHGVIIAGHPTGEGSPDIEEDLDDDLAVAKGLFASKGFGITDPLIFDALTAPEETMAWSNISQSILALDMQCCDELVIYFTGHAEPGGGLTLTSDINNDVAAIEINLLLNELARQGKVCKVMLIIDACYSGKTIASVKSRLEKARGGPLDRIQLVGVHATAADEESHSGGYGTLSSGEGSWFTQLKLGQLRDQANGAGGAWSWSELRSAAAGITGTTLSKTLLTASLWPYKTASQTSGWDYYLPTRPCCGCGNGVVEPQCGEECEPGVGMCEGDLACREDCTCPECDDDADCDEDPSGLCKAWRCVEGECVEQDEADGTLCEPGSGCTDKVCESGACAKTVNKADGTACDDGEPCTGNDACQQGTCAGVELSDCCESDAECDDGESCTEDSCQDHACQHAPLSGPACDDGDPCTNGDICIDGACLSGAPKDCDDGNACTSDSCLEGDCVHQALNGAGCDDGDVCTTGDVCVQGSCQGQPKEPCCAVDADCDDGNPCTTDSCVDGGCTHTPADGGACDDGDACTTNDVCSGGACSGTPLTCFDGDPCTSDACDPASGCSYPPLCEDDNECTEDQCSAGECTYVALNGVACDDGDACTEEDVCTQGACQGSPACCAEDADCDDGDPCTDDACDGSGCSSTPAPDGTACAPDGMMCVASAACQMGTCQPAPTLFQLPAGGAIAPELGGQATDMPPGFDFGQVGHLTDGATVGFALQTIQPIPNPPPAQITFVDFTLLLYGPGPGQGQLPHPPWQGATHALSVGWTPDGGWQGHLWTWDDAAQSWTLTQAGLPFMLEGDMVQIGAQVPGVDGCTPFKVFSQIVEDGVLKWKALTMGPDGQPSSDPNQPPIALFVAPL